jgi:hypothetical protein
VERTFGHPKIGPNHQHKLALLEAFGKGIQVFVFVLALVVSCRVLGDMAGLCGT